MKKAVIIAALLFASACNADEKMDKKYDATVLKYCELVEKLASMIMQKRQEGVSMSELMTGSLGEGELSKILIVEAYQKPRFTTAKNQQAMTVDFANMTAAACYRRLQQNR